MLCGFPGHYPVMSRFFVKKRNLMVIFVRGQIFGGGNVYLLQMSFSGMSGSFSLSGNLHNTGRLVFWVGVWGCTDVDANTLEPGYQVWSFLFWHNTTICTCTVSHYFSFCTRHVTKLVYTRSTNFLHVLVCTELLIDMGSILKKFSLQCLKELIYFVS